MYVSTNIKKIPIDVKKYFESSFSFRKLNVDLLSMLLHISSCALLESFHTTQNAFPNTPNKCVYALWKITKCLICMYYVLLYNTYILNMFMHVLCIIIMYFAVAAITWNCYKLCCWKYTYSSFIHIYLHRRACNLNAYVRAWMTVCMAVWVHGCVGR